MIFKIVLRSSFSETSQHFYYMHGDWPLSQPILDQVIFINPHSKLEWTEQRFPQQCGMLHLQPFYDLLSVVITSVFLLAWPLPPNSKLFPPTISKVRAACFSSPSPTFLLSSHFPADSFTKCITCRPSSFIYQNQILNRNYLASLKKHENFSTWWNHQFYHSFLQF